MPLQQSVTVYADGTHTRDSIERGLSLHREEGRIIRWGRDPDGGNGAIISLSPGAPAATRTLRETALFVLGLGSAAQAHWRVWGERPADIRDYVNQPLS